jgi:hypothetical protein
MKYSKMRKFSEKNENTNKIFINSKSEVPADYLTTEGMY